MEREEPLFTREARVCVRARSKGQGTRFLSAYPTLSRLSAWRRQRFFFPIFSPDLFSIFFLNLCTTHGALLSPCVPPFFLCEKNKIEEIKVASRSFFFYKSFKSFFSFSQPLLSLLSLKSTRGNRLQLPRRAPA